MFKISLKIILILNLLLNSAGLYPAASEKKDALRPMAFKIGQTAQPEWSRLIVGGLISHKAIGTSSPSSADFINYLALRVMEPNGIDLKELTRGRDVILLGGSPKEAEYVKKRCPFIKKIHIVNIYSNLILSMAEEVYKRDGPEAFDRYAFYNRNITDLEGLIPDKSMALAVCIGVLEPNDYRTAEIALRQAERILIPGGIGFISGLPEWHIDLKSFLSEQARLFTCPDKELSTLLFAFQMKDKPSFSTPQKSSSAGKIVPEWPKKVWDAVNELGIAKAKLMIYPHFAEYLSEKLGVDVMFLDARRLAQNRILYKVNQNVMSALTEDEYQKLLDDPEVGEYRLKVCGIDGPGICIMEDVQLLAVLSPYYERALHTYVFHEFCEYLESEEGNMDELLNYFHGHCSLRVLVETFKVADRIGELRILLRDWKTDFALVISEHRPKYPAMLYKKFTRLLELAESGAMFKHGTDEVLAMLDEAAKATNNFTPSKSAEVSPPTKQKLQFDVDIAISSAA